MIPNRIVFIWLGKTLPWSAGVAIRSASRVQAPDELVLYHEGLEFQGEGWDLVAGLPGLRLVAVSDALFDGLNDDGICLRLFHELKSPATRANLLRLAVLYRWGGVYLDTDVIAVRPWGDLLSLPGFCGTEPIAMPADLFGSWNPLRWLACGLRFAWRDLCTRIPRGEQWFRLFEGSFVPAANNAVIGAEAGNALLEMAFSTIQSMDESLRRKRFRLGTHLLQRLTGNRSQAAMTVFPAMYFYPVGPEVSCHWFRDGSASRLQEMLYPETRIVHWYNSVEGRFLTEPLDKNWVQAHPDSAFSELVRRYAN